MSDTLNTAVGALNSSAARIVKATSSIVNASSTGTTADIAASAVSLIQEKTQYAAEAKIIKAVAKNNKTLVDILA